MTTLACSRMMRPMLWMRYFLISGIFSGILSFAQSPQSSTPATEDSTQAYVIEDLSTKIAVADDDRWERHAHVLLRVTSQAGVQQAGLLVIPYAKASNSLQIDYVRVKKPNGKIIETPTDDIEDMASEITRQAPEYSDMREKHLAVRGLEIGDELEYALTLREHTPLIPGHFWFADDFSRQEVIRQQDIEISFPKDKFVTVKSRVVQPTIREEGNRKIYTWKYSNPAIKKEAAERIPAPPDILVSTFRTWDELGQWWSALLKDRVAASDEITLKANSLIAKTVSPEEKAKIIYGYVATRYRYIGVSFGIGRFQPHAASEVFQNGYGDCKDKHTLLAAMLGAAGQRTYPALMNTTRAVDPDVPSPGQFDHVISVIPVGDKQVWTDATQEIAPYGYLLFGLRDRHALVIRDNKATLEKTPTDTPFEARTEFKADVSLDSDGTAKGKFQVTSRGDSEIIYRSAFRSVPPSKWQEFAQRISYSLGYGGNVSNVTVSDPGKTSEPFRFGYDYTRTNYSDWENKRITPPLPPSGLAQRDDQQSNDEPLPENILIGAPGVTIMSATLKVPTQYTLAVPAPVHITTDFAEYTAQYAFKDDVLTATRTVTIKKAEIPQSRRGESNKFRRDVYDDETQFIALVTQGESRQEIEAKTSSAPVPFGPEAYGYLTAARNAFQNRNFKEVEENLNKLAKIAPSNPDVWGMRASLEFSRGNTDAGVANLRKVIELQPKASQAYLMLGSYLMSTRNFEEAAKVFREGAAALPEVADLQANLGSAEYQLKHYTASADAYKRAVDAKPDSAAFRAGYAEAVLKSGHPEIALKIMKDSVEKAGTPRALNGYAYTLAEANTGLDEALKYAAEAVNDLELESSVVSLKKLEFEDTKRMSDLAAYWDTLGWVHFKRGELDAAERYLKASWNLFQQAVVGDHLAQVYEKNGKRKIAVATYELVMATNRADESMRVRMQALASKEAAERARSYSQGDLQQLREAHFSYTSPKPQTGEFFLLFDPAGNIEETKFVGGDAKMRDAEKKLFDLKFPGTVQLEGSKAKIVRRVVVVCSGGASGCEAVLIPVDAVTSVQ